MSKMRLANGRVIGDYQRPYIIAELNSSHDGDVGTAKQMIDAAKNCGCDCVKLQSYSSSSLFSEEYYEKNRIIRRIIDKFSMGEEELRTLAEYCMEVGVDFSSTPYSETEADFLDEIGVPFIKISSMEVNNLPYLRYIAQLGRPMIFSTGMATYDEIREAIKTIEETGNKEVCLLHCVSVYPASSDIINLNNIHSLREMFPAYPIGYSDHTIGMEVPCASVALGVAVIEKHFTLDNSKMGMENDMATEPEMMKAMVNACDNVYRALGSHKRILSEDEIEYAGKMRRSLVTTRDMQAGEVFKAEDITVRRPGTGLEPGWVDEVIGKTLVNDIKRGYLIHMEDMK